MDNSPMKMPSTYISLLIGGLMFVFYVAQPYLNQEPKASLSMQKMRVIKMLPAGMHFSHGIFKNKNHQGHFGQTKLNEPAFSFFRDILHQVVPALNCFE